MNPNISEFSYGFALTKELVDGLGPLLIAAPILPSLYQEGKSGGGWDLRLDRPGAPLFLQFKLAQRMIRKSCKEAKDGGFVVPCYRIPIRRAPSKQHEMLLQLEAGGDDVYYVAPQFDQPNELNEAFLASEVCARSVWIPPSQIGPITDGKDHHVSFEKGGKLAVFSKPRDVDGPHRFGDIAVHLAESLRRRGATPLQEDLVALSDRVAAIAETRGDVLGANKDATKARLAARPPIERVAHYASVFLECQLLIVQER